MTYIVDPINNTLIDDEKPFTRIANNLGKNKKEVPVRKPGAVPPKTTQIIKAKSGGPVKPVVRKENMDERIQRMVYQYDGNKNDRPPPHYNNPNIIDEENWKKPPKKFSSSDPSSYPSDRDQRQRLSSWDLIVQSAKGKPSEMREVRDILRKHHKSNPGSLTDSELKMIGKYKPKDQKVVPTIDIPIPRIDPNFYNRAVGRDEITPTPEPIINKRTPIEDDPKYRGTIFGSDTYYRRKRGLDD